MQTCTEKCVRGSVALGLVVRLLAHTVGREFAASKRAAFLGLIL